MKLHIAVVAAACCFATAANADDKAMKANAPATKPAAEAKTNEMKADMKDASAMTWKPSKVTDQKAAQKGLEELTKADEAAMKANSIEQMAANVDFPVTMITDDSAGNASGGSWTKDQFVKVMTESMKNMPKDMKVSHKFKYDILTDALAVVHDDVSMTHGKEKMSNKTASIAVKKDGKWMWKTMVEGGWGDMKAATKATGGSGATTP